MARLRVRRKKNAETKKKGSNEQLFDIWKILTQRKYTSWFSGHTNADCICCRQVAKEMIRTGSLIFCVHCFNAFFDANAEMRNKEQYSKWLEVQKEQWEKELD